MRYSFIIAVGLFLLAGCSRAPSIADARAAFEEDVANISEGRAQVVQFSKRDGTHARAAGDSAYVLEFVAELQVQMDSGYQVGSFSDLEANRRPYSFIAIPASQDVEAIKKSVSGLTYDFWRKGDAISVSGEMAFVKKDSGWVVQAIACKFAGQPKPSGGRVEISGAGFQWR